MGVCDWSVMTPDDVFRFSFLDIMQVDIKLCLRWLLNVLMGEIEIDLLNNTNAIFNKRNALWSICSKIVTETIHAKTRYA